MRLTPGTPAPPFSVQDIAGQLQTVPSGQPTLLLFFRYASCPFCNLHLHHVAQRAPEWQAKGLRILAVFQSPAEYVRVRLARHHVPFPLLADPTWQLYALYGVETSWAGYARGSVNPAIVTALTKGFWPGAMHGPKATLPADFLIHPDGSIAEAHYSNAISTHMPLERVEQWLQGFS